MAKKKNKPRLRMPRLSALDKFIYWMILLALCALLFGYIIGTLVLQREVAFRDEAVLASSDHISFLWFLVPFMALFLVTLLLWLWAYQGRKPIFGLRDFKYGPPAYPKEYPLFMKDKPPVYISPRKKKERRQIVLLLAAVLVISFIPYPWSLYGRDALHRDGTIVQYNMFGGEARTFSRSDIEALEIGTYRYTTGKYTREKHWGVSMTFTTETGKSYTFRYGEFRDDLPGESSPWLRGMLQIKDRFDPGIITYSGLEDLEKVVNDKALSDAEAQLLYQLFSD